MPRTVALTASWSPRLDVLRLAAENYASSFDLWVVYLNDIHEVPDFLKRPGVRVILGKDDLGDIKDLAKFHLSEIVTEGDIHFMLDDDLVLPPDFVPAMTGVLEQYGRRAVVSTYGGYFKGDPIEHYNRDRVGMGTMAASVDRVREVEWVGSGIAVYDPALFRPTKQDAPEPHMGDIWLSIAAWKAGIPLVLAPHERGWVSFIEESYKTPSVFDISTTPQAQRYAQTVNRHRHLCPTIPGAKEWVEEELKRRSGGACDGAPPPAPPVEAPPAAPRASILRRIVRKIRSFRPI